MLENDIYDNTVRDHKGNPAKLRHVTMVYPDDFYRESYYPKLKFTSSNKFVVSDEIHSDLKGLRLAQEDNPSIEHWLMRINFQGSSHRVNRIGSATRNGVKWQFALPEYLHSGSRYDLFEPEVLDVYHSHPTHSPELDGGHPDGLMFFSGGDIRSAVNTPGSRYWLLGKLGRPALCAIGSGKQAPNNFQDATHEYEDSKDESIKEGFRNLIKCLDYCHIQLFSSIDLRQFHQLTLDMFE